ncbi:MAG: UDP-N-acetylmuramate--L-alanine ligase [Ferruginibacter sp.]
MKELNKILSALGAAKPQKDAIASVCFLGIGGIGMSALARYFNSINVAVSGYDKTETALTKQLSAEGINIHYKDSIDNINKSVQVVVYTPALPKNHQELNFYRDNNYTVVKRSDVLGAITNSSFNICIAGTHGKTTTSTMVAHILRHSAFGCKAFLGGIAVNYSSNFWNNEKNVCVVEADEYDRSFLKLNPDIAVISSMDPDHLDIYGTAENMEQAFIEFAGKVKPGGFLLHKYGLKRNAELVADEFSTYHLFDKNADVYAANININNGSYVFDVFVNDAGTTPWILKNVVLNMGGEHNIENVIAAITVAHRLEIEDQKILDAVADFAGVKRRFEYILKNSKQVYIDDYAHHPEELRALITGAKTMFPGKKCIIVFQPHLFSRTRDLADGFAEVLDLADEIILLPIYPARELPIDNVSSQLILDKMHSENRIIMSREDLLKHFTATKNMYLEEGFEGTVLITAGAGDIDTLVDPIKEILMVKNQ